MLLFTYPFGEGWIANMFVCFLFVFTYKTKSQAKTDFTERFIVLKGSRHLFQLVPGQEV